MGLFKKKEEKKVYLPTAETLDKETEAAKLKALEASLEFLNNPKAKEENKKKEEEAAPEHEEGSSEGTANEAAKEEAGNAKTGMNKTLTPGVKANPVAPAVQPPSGKTLDPNAQAQNPAEKKAESAPVPKVPEVTEEKAPATATTSMASKQWGRRMDYRTAVVKPQPPEQKEAPVKPLAPTSVSNVPPAPRMPSNSLHTLNSQNSQKKLEQQQTAQPAVKQPQEPAKTIVPAVPQIPGKGAKAEKPTVAAMNTPIPATVENAPTIVASGIENTPVPQAKSAVKAPEAENSPKPEAAEVSEKASAAQKEASIKQEQEATPKTDLKAAPAATQTQKASPVQMQKAQEEKGLKAGNTGMIPNPLPTPKKHVPKEMDFDIQPPASQMHFDIVDMTGMDFFDIN